MNMYTFEIAKLLKISNEEAVKVQNEMECWGFDFSESSTREFNRAAREAFAEINAK